MEQIESSALPDDRLSVFHRGQMLLSRTFACSTQRLSLWERGLSGDSGSDNRGYDNLDRLPCESRFNIDLRRIQYLLGHENLLG